ncbi:MAG: 50S ribosomal protein L9 [Candidatus Pacebacteria bacterium]|nr:50S ribosomal protein L9 [Candidatus Paceibacterota bacterium]
MKVIFIKKVPKVGNIGEVKDQPDGYVRNFLLPKGLAIVATPQEIKKLEQSRNEIRVEKEIQGDLFKKNLMAIKGVDITIPVKTNDKGSLFKAIHESDIALALKKQCHITISPEFIKLPAPIKQNGTFNIKIEALGMSEVITVQIIKA